MTCRPSARPAKAPAPPSTCRARAAPMPWLQGLFVGLLSSVIPYGLEMVALRRIEPRVFSILMSLEPAMAALAALVLLGEGLRAVEIVAMACVVVASIGVVVSSRR